MNESLTDLLASISGKLRIPQQCEESAWIDVMDPSTNKLIHRVVDAPVDLSAQFVSTAFDAQVKWERESPRVRGDIIRRAYEILISRREDVARVITAEMGKPFRESLTEVDFSAQYWKWFSEEAVRSYGTYREAPSGDARLITTRRAVGTCFLITPWNFPLAMAARKVAPALAAGCSVILKPASETPLTALLMADILYEAGVDRSLLQVITTSSTSAWSQAVMSDPRVKKVSFTGSTSVGSLIIKQSAQNITRLSLELGGDAPFIVLNDADLDRAVSAAIVAKFRNGGQACVAANRFLVQDGIADEFMSEFTRRVLEMSVGGGFDEHTEIGPLINRGARDSIDDLVSDAVGLGASVYARGGSLAGPGNFFSPSVLVNAPTHARIIGQEIFGPVALVRTFGSVDEAIDLANDTPYGLAAYVFSQDIDSAFGVASSLRTGTVGINKGLVADASSEFGGNDQSGYGREGGIEGIQDYQILRQFNLSASNDRWRF